MVSPPRVVRHHARPQPKKEVPIASPISVVVHPDIAGGPGATLRPAASPVAVSMSHGSSSFLKLALAAALVLSLLVVALALAPPRLVPEPLELRLYGRHEDLIVGGLATALSIGFGLLIVLFVS